MANCEQLDAEHGLPDGPLSPRGVRQAEAIASKCTEAVCAQRDECENATNEALAQLEAGSSAAAAPAAAAPSV